MTLTPEDLARCTQVLEAIAQDSMLLSPMSEAERIKLLVAAGRVIHPEKIEVRRRLKAMRRFKREKRQAQDRSARADAGIRAARLESVFVPPKQELLEGPGSEAPRTAGRLLKPRDCYICKNEYSDVHFFYDSMCASCGALNYSKRFQTARLDGRVALITGARLKIGYQAALMMLRAGAQVIVTTRFPQDAAARYAREEDFGQWKGRLQIHGLDLRHSPSVEIFTRFLEQTCTRLDILINNAAQTVRRPPGFYAHLLAGESRPFSELSAEVQPLLRAHEECKKAFLGTRDQLSADSTWLSNWHIDKTQVAAAAGLVASAQLSQVPYACETAPPETAFPEGKLDADLQQVDLRAMNSWRMTLADVPTAEMLEVQLVNAVAPFVLCSKLKPLMLRDQTGEKHIVNVSAMEGKFHRHTKTDKHPHTNMAKAALNMMTLTSARDYAASGIYMNAVDTGWVTDEDPAAITARKQAEHDFHPPLDIVDGAARVCDPFFAGLISGKHSWGCFLKDYFPTAW